MSKETWIVSEDLKTAKRNPEVEKPHYTDVKYLRIDDNDVVRFNRPLYERDLRAYNAALADAETVDIPEQYRHLIKPFQELREGVDCKIEYRWRILDTQEIVETVQPFSNNGAVPCKAIVPLPPTTAQEEALEAAAQYDLERLYEWLMDENRKPAITSFTSGTARNIASEIEFRLKALHGLNNGSKT